MNVQLSRRSAVLCLLLATLAAAPTAQAAERRFEPVPQSEAQVVKMVADSSIISSAGKQFHAGASIAPESSRKAWLSVSVKNMTAAPLAFGPDAITAAGNGKLLTITRADEALKGSKDDGYVRDPCANATSSSQINCTIDAFNRRQAERVADDAAGAKPAAEQLGSGQLVVRQFQVDLPKQSKSGPLLIKVSITLGGEAISFDFKEVD